ncbi:MAG TPA: carboxymuconolactone decarboxylase family protein [Sphaerochaeta sp.]|nr:carboxymuconolactone decarboxylase family protein [Sphaerochaeta sp.]HQB90077.1 carboxymuconolactone decarboxylase family protein [Sphaerochaeta sp.]
MIIKTDRYRHRYTVGEMYRVLLAVLPSIGILKRNRKDEIVDAQFVERLMLAVTEVNGCAVCSYAHAKMALEGGFSEEEVAAFLGGSDTFVKAEEATAILFAQSYADAAGVLDEEQYARVVAEYGEEKSEVILAAIRGMMGGNVIGLPYSALQSRFKAKVRYTNSSLFYEIGMSLAPLLLIPVALLHHLVRRIVSLFH